jgi:hypothetical protein
MEKVTLEYRRERTKSATKGLKSLVVGRVLYEPEDGAEEEEAFESEDFSKMMGMYASALKAHPNAAAYFHRKDRPNMPVMPLDPLTLDGLRKNTEETLKKLSNPPSIDAQGRRKNVSKKEIMK